ncbi:hypothetical protein GTP81_24965 [Rugamonas sp. FT107W]|uniref:Uncharacterized protein n=1 Tax=Duganella vulcania TaxID=2692166 RepID=A0A845HRE7_9BURK|nr:hypothetical protein [Duganella vulcania]MYN19999.1 hypothetical protein [Duganella vulcania]
MDSRLRGNDELMAIEDGCRTSIHSLLRFRGGDILRQSLEQGLITLLTAELME